MRCVSGGGGGLDIFTLRCLWGEWLFILRSLWISKTVLKLLIRYPMSPSEVYTITFSIQILYSSVAKLTALGLRAMWWGVVILKDIISDLSIALNKIAVSKFWLDMFGEMVGVGGGLVAHQWFSTIKKGTSPFSFQSNDLFPMFQRHQMAFSKFLSDALRENMRYVRGIGYTLLSLWILKRTRELLITNPMNPFKVYKATLSLYTSYVKGHNLKSLSWGL